MLFKNFKEIIENGRTSEIKKARKDVLNILSAALNAVDPYNAVKNFLDKQKIDISDFKDIYLIGFGKASIKMTKAVCDTFKIKKGIVITNETKKKLDNNIQVFTGGHPLPNENSINGTEKTLQLIEKCRENDLLIVLISGGGSALLSKPRIPLNDLKKTTDLLLKSGANIKEINTIRKHLSLVKGGQLIKKAKCKVISLIISDIIGDPIQFIASGPTYPDSTTFSDAEEILRKNDLWEKIPFSAKKIIQDGKKGLIPETPKQDDSVFEKVNNFIIANNKTACEHAEKKAEELGYKTLFLTSSLEGEARETGKYLIEKAKNHLTNEKTVFISGGETTVTVKGKGDGGRNQEMVLGAIETLSNENMVFSSFATDGIDGKSDAAGAIADGFSYKKALEKNLDPEKYLKNNNSYEFFKENGDLLITGPTGTNVMDIQIILKLG